MDVDVLLDEDPDVAGGAPRPRRPWALGGALVAVAWGARPQAAPGPDRTAVVAPRLAGAVAPSLASPWVTRFVRQGEVVVALPEVTVVAGPGGVEGLDGAGARLWGPVAGGTTCGAAGRVAVCLGDPASGRVTLVGPDGSVRDVPAPAPAVDWWVEAGDVVQLEAVAGRGDAVVVRRWSPAGGRGPDWRVEVDGATPQVARRTATTLVLLGDPGRTLSLTTGRDGSGGAPTPRARGWVSDSAGLGLVTDGTDVVVAGVGWFPAPAHLLLDGVLLAGTDHVSAYDLEAGGAALWAADASGAFSDGERVALVERSGEGRALVVRALRSGEELWRTDLPSGCLELAAVTARGALLDGCGAVAAVGPG